MGQEFYRELAQQARGLAERADPFTRQRLLKLAGSEGRQFCTVATADGASAADSAYHAAGVDLFASGRGLMKFSAGHTFADPEAAARKRDRAPLMVPSFAMAAAPAAVSEWAGHSRSNAIGSSGMRPERM